MRIALITSQFPGIRMGGIGGYTRAAAEALASLGHEVHIFTFSVLDDARNMLPKNVTLHSIADLAERVVNEAVAGELAAALESGGEVMHRLSLGTLLADAVISEHHRVRFDVVEGPEYEGLTLSLIWRLRDEEPTNRPAVVTHIHSGSSIHRRGNELSAMPEDSAIDAIEQAAILHADAVCAATEAVVRETKVTLLFDRKVEIIPLAVDSTESFTPPPLTGSVLFVGRLERLKGVDTLALAANIFLKRCADATVTLIGPDTPTAPAAAAERSMKNWMVEQLDPSVRSRVIFSGQIAPHDVAAHMKACRFLVAPSLFENFSLVASEAIALGRPVICTEGTGTVEVAGNGGLVVVKRDAMALAAAMERLWNSSALMNELAHNAHHHAQGAFSLDTVTKRRVKFYEHAIAAMHTGRAAVAYMRDAGTIEPLLAISHILSGVRAYNAPPTPGQRLLAVMEKIANETRASAQVILYGAGRYSSRLMAEQYVWTSRGHRVVGFMDDAKRWENGGTHLGLPVISREVLRAEVSGKRGISSVVLATDAFEDQFWNQTKELRSQGIAVYRLSSVSKQSFFP